MAGYGIGELVRRRSGGPSMLVVNIVVKGGCVVYVCQTSTRIKDWEQGRFLEEEIERVPTQKGLA